MVMRLLKMQGHICYEAKDGAAAVEMISSLYGYNSDPKPAFATIDAVLMDKHMPHLTGTQHTVHSLSHYSLIELTN